MSELLDSTPVFVIIFFVLGLLWGSFSNVVILRLPEGESVVRPRSRCPECKSLIRWFDNIPVFSWLILRGKCRACGTKISWRYPLVELLMGCFFAICFYHVGWQWVLIEYLIFIFALVTASFIDFDRMILPDIFTLSGIVIGLVGSIINPEREFFPALMGVLMGGGFLWAIAYVYFAIRKEEGMGGGDIKLLAWIGAVLGWQAIPFVILASSIIGSVVGLLVAAQTKGGFKTAIPFGPYLAFAAIVYVLGGQGIGEWYLNLFIPSIGPVN